MGKANDMKKYLVMALGLGLLAGPAPAMTNQAPGSVPDVLMTDVQAGTVERIDGSAFTVKGKTYFLSAATGIYNSDGRSSAAHLAVGKPVSFTVIDDASKNRIKQLWIH